MCVRGHVAAWHVFAVPNGTIIGVSQQYSAVHRERDRDQVRVSLIPTPNRL